MIHYVKIHRENGVLAFTNNDDPERMTQHDAISGVEFTIDKHFGLKVQHGDDGSTLVMLRVGGNWSEPELFSDLAKRITRARD